MPIVVATLAVLAAIAKDPRLRSPLGDLQHQALAVAVAPARMLRFNLFCCQDVDRHGGPTSVSTSEMDGYSAVFRQLRRGQQFSNPLVAHSF